MALQRGTQTNGGTINSEENGDSHLMEELENLTPYASIYVAGYQQLAGWNGRLMLKRLSETNNGIIGRLVVRMQRDWGRICKKMRLTDLWQEALDGLTINELPKVLAYDQPFLSSIFAQFPRILSLLLQKYLGLDARGNIPFEEQVNNIEKEIKRLKLQQELSIISNEISVLTEKKSRIPSELTLLDFQLNLLKEKLMEIDSNIQDKISELNNSNDEPYKENKYSEILSCVKEKDHYKYQEKLRQNEKFQKQKENYEIDIEILRYQKKQKSLDGEISELNKKECEKFERHHISVDFFLKLLENEICLFLLYRNTLKLSLSQNHLLFKAESNFTLNNSNFIAPELTKLQIYANQLYAGSEVNPETLIKEYDLPIEEGNENKLAQLNIFANLLLKTNINSTNLLVELKKSINPELSYSDNITLNKYIPKLRNKLLSSLNKQKLVNFQNKITETEINQFLSLPLHFIADQLDISGCFCNESISFSSIKSDQEKFTNSFDVDNKDLEREYEEILVVDNIPFVINKRGDQSLWKEIRVGKSFEMPAPPSGYTLKAISSNDNFRIENSLDNSMVFSYGIHKLPEPEDQEFTISFNIIYEANGFSDLNIVLYPKFYYVPTDKEDDFLFEYEELEFRTSLLKEPLDEIRLSKPKEHMKLIGIEKTNFITNVEYKNRSGGVAELTNHSFPRAIDFSASIASHEEGVFEIKFDNVDSGNSSTVVVYPLLIYSLIKNESNSGQCVYDPTLVRLILYTSLLKIPMIRNAVQVALNEAFRPLEKYYKALAISALSETESKFALSPIGLLDVYKQHFYDCGTFLGPPIDHVWAASNSKVEHTEIVSLTEHMSKETETFSETETTEEKSQSTKSDFLDELMQERENNVSFGTTLDVSGGIGLINASSSTSFDFDQRTSTSHRQTTNKTIEQSNRISNRMKKSRRETTFRSITRFNENIKRHLIDNTGFPTSNYEVRRKYQRIGLALEWVGTRLCWQFYIDDPASLLAKSELVHYAGSQDFYDLPELVQDEIPTEDIIITDQEFYIPFNQTQGDDTQAIYEFGQRGSEHIQFKWGFEVSNVPFGYEIKEIGMNSGNRPRGEGREAHEDEEPRNPTVFEYKVNEGEIKKATNEFTVTLTTVNFNDAAGVYIQPKIVLTPTTEIVEEIKEKNKTNKDEFEAEKARILKLEMERKRKEKVEAERSIRSRDSSDLRNEERYAIFRALSVKFASSSDGEELKQVSELLGTLFELDMMMFYVAPDWWKPRFHGTRKRAGKPERSSSVYGKRFQLDDYDITPDSEPAPYGSSLGWMLQLDGDDQRNSFLNSSWIKVVLPIKQGMGVRAKNWLMQDNIEGSDIEQDLLDLIIAAENYEVNESEETIPKLQFSQFGESPINSFEGPQKNEDGEWRKVCKTWLEIVPTKQTVAMDVEYENKDGLLMPKKKDS